jgi:hypothetical protein
MTYHPDGAPQYNSSNWFHRDVWLDFNGIETWKSIDEVYRTVLRDYQLQDPTKPTMLLEGAYEQGKYPSPGDRVSARKARQQFYHTIFAGGAGHTYGGFPVWDFTRDGKNDSYGHTWRDAVEQFPGAAQVATVGRQLLAGSEWWSMSPCPELIQGDAGSGAEQVVALRADSGQRILVYLSGHRSVQVKLDVAGATPVPVHWFDPRTGHRTAAGQHEPGHTVSFTPPANFEDALLVVGVLRVP